MHYSQEDQDNARLGTIPLAGTDVEIVAYRTGEDSLVLLANKGPKCVYRVTLLHIFQNLLAHTDPHPLIEDSFTVRDVTQVKDHIGHMSAEEISTKILARLKDFPQEGERKLKDVITRIEQLRKELKP